MVFQKRLVDMVNEVLEDPTSSQPDMLAALATVTAQVAAAAGIRLEQITFHMEGVYMDTRLRMTGVES